MSDVVAVVCVFESSLALAAEWPQVLGEYLVPLLARLGEAHASPSFRMAFVSYATADTRPTPILSSAFFSQPSVIMKAMREQPHECGIGQTTSGGGYGMAALEGIVAAMEMFEMFKTLTETPHKANVQSHTYHLIHLACTPPDSADRPLWNSLPAYDSVSWNTLPADLKERKINYSTVLLKQIPRLSKLQSSATVGSPQSPWFTVRSPHVVHLSGFPQKGTKRPGNNGQAPDQSPEISKRSKVQSSPKKSPATPVTPATTHATTPVMPPSSSPPAAPAAPAPPAPPAPSAPVPGPAPTHAPPPVPAPAPPATTTAHPPVPGPAPGPTNPNPNMQNIGSLLSDPTQLAALHDRLRSVELTLRQDVMRANELERAGRMAEAMERKKDMRIRAEKLKLFRLQLMQAQQAHMKAQGQAQAQGGPSGSAKAADTSATQPPTGPNAGTSGGGAKPPEPPAPAGPSTAMDVTVRPVSGVGQRPTPVLPPAVLPGSKGPPPLPIDPNIAAQVTKLIEQTNKHPPGISAQPSGARPASPEKPQAPAAGVQGLGSWQGMLTWGGFDSETHARKNLQTQVVMQCPHAEKMRADQWPNVLLLAPSQHPAVPMPMLFQWLQRQQCVVMNTVPHPQVADTKTNEEHFRQLNRLLTEKNVYALSSWGATPENRLLIFPHNVLSAAYFYGPGGMPELPKISDNVPMPGPSPMPPPTANPAQNPAQNQNQNQNPSGSSALALQQQRQMFAQIFQGMPPEQQAALRKMTPEKQAPIMRAILARVTQAREQQQQQQQQQQQHQLQQQQQHQQQQQQHQQQMHAQMINMNQQQQQQQQQQQSQMQPQGLNPWVQGGQQPNIAAFLSHLASTGHVQAGPSNPTAQQQQQAQAQAQAQAMMGGPNPMANLMMSMGGMAGQMGMGNMNFGMGMPQPGQGQQGQHGQGQGQQGQGGPPGAGMHRRTPSGNMQVSYEMLQSFIQRNQESGGGGPGAGPPNGSLGGMA